MMGTRKLHAPFAQLRCLGDDEPETIFAAVPLWRWVDKQVVVVPNVNIYTVMRELYEEIEAASPALQALKAAVDGVSESARAVDRFCEGTREMIDEAEQLSAMRAPLAYGW